MTGYNLPPGCEVSHLPGNTDADVAFDMFCDAIDKKFPDLTSQDVLAAWTMADDKITAISPGVLLVFSKMDVYEAIIEVHNHLEKDDPASFKRTEDALAEWFIYKERPVSPIEEGLLKQQMTADKLTGVVKGETKTTDQG